jgi:diguanylate cyclase (GGDEF)-like protein
VTDSNSITVDKSQAGKTMELKAYIRIFLKYWYWLPICVVFTLLATFLFTLRQTEVYEANTTFVIRPHSTLIVEDEFVKTLETLSRRVEINNTFAEVANSNLIKNKAAEDLALSNSQKKSLSVSGRVLAGTNILAINVKGNDPELVRDFTETVSVETINFVNNLYDVFELEQLDQAVASSRPISPNMMLNLAVGLVLGVAIGLAIIYLADYLGGSVKTARYFDIIDPDTGIYTKDFFELRLRQEISRARRHGRPLSLALITMKNYGIGNGAAASLKRELMPRIAVLFGPYLRDEDVLARFDTATFALMMPDISGELARRRVETLRIEVSSTPADLNEQEALANIHIVASVVELTASDLDGEGLLAEAEDALRDANSGTYGKVIFKGAAYPGLPQPKAKLSAGPANGIPKQAPKSEFAQVIEPLSNGGVAEGSHDDSDGKIIVTTNGTSTERHSDILEIISEESSKELNTKITRAALKMAKEYGIDLHTVRGSGKDGRILKTDIEASIRTN